MAWRKLEDTFYDNPKLKRLSRHLACSRAQAAGHVALLWSWALRHAPDGDITKYDDEDIEDAVEWPGTRGEFLAACVKVSLVDEVQLLPERVNTDPKLLHDRVNTEVQFLPERVKVCPQYLPDRVNSGDEILPERVNTDQVSLQPATKRFIHNWLSRGGSYADSMRKRLKNKELADSGADVPGPSQDFPGNSRKFQERPGNSSLEEKRREENRRIYTCDDAAPIAKNVNHDATAKAAGISIQPDPPTDPPAGRSGIEAGKVHEVWEHYRSYHPHTAKELKSRRKEYRIIRERLRDFPVAALKLAIDGYHKSPFHTGQNERHKKYLALDLILRDISHVQAGLEFLEPASRGNGSKKLLDESAMMGDVGD